MIENLLAVGTFFDNQWFLSDSDRAYLHVELLMLSIVGIGVLALLVDPQFGFLDEQSQSIEITFNLLVVSMAGSQTVWVKSPASPYAS